MSQIKDCLIVAAGKGTRLKQYGDIKPLVPVQGCALIERSMITALSAGVNRFVVITGYKADILEAALTDIANRNDFNIITIFNPEFEKPNGLSVLAGRRELTDEFYLTMCDHLVEGEIFSRLAAAPLANDAVALGVDYRLENPDVDIEDVTKVNIIDGCIKEIGKEISSYNCFDTGVFRASAALFNAIEKSRDETGDCSISGGMKMLARDNRAIGVDTADARWIDVDSPAMHDLATEWIRSKTL